MGVPVAELAAIVERGEAVAYEAGAACFTNRRRAQWLGIVAERARSRFVRGLHGRQTHLATLDRRRAGLRRHAAR